MSMKKEIPIFFATDNQYAPYLGVAVRSIIDNANRDDNYKVIILHDNLDEEYKKKINSFKRDFFDIEFVSLNKGLECITNRDENRLRCDYFTLTIYYRLFIPDMFPKYDKAIYIDSDIVVLEDISKLYNIELQNNLIGACTDNSILDIPEIVKYIEYGIGVKKTEYINSGVLLMNLKEMRNKNFSKGFLNLFNTYHFDNIAPDQDYINAMCNGRIKYLDEAWDTMPNNNKLPLESPNLIHYNLFQKPWCYDDIQYEDYFWQYAHKTPFYEIICDFKKNYTAFQKKSDSKCLETLIKKAFDIPDKDLTFKKLYDKGVKIRI